MSATIPIINVQSLKNENTAAEEANKIGVACREHGFFYIAQHGVNEALQDKLHNVSKAFFALPESEKIKIAMIHGGKAWRGYFPLHGEMTSGKPDRKEGIYFGTELDANDPRVQAGMPLHGQNLFPETPQEMRETILEYIKTVTELGHVVMKGVSLSLGLSPNYFLENYNQEPLILFRIFHYPAQASEQAEWGVGEHTDYGLLTILLQDEVGGLQVKSNGEWIDAPPIENTFVCNIGDMLDKMTGGFYRSTPHRVLNKSGKSRLSFPLFFDPGFDTLIQRIEGINVDHITTANERWDKEDIHQFGDTYGNYLLKKIGKVFPDLKNQVL